MIELRAGPRRPSSRCQIRGDGQPHIMGGGEVAPRNPAAWPAVHTGCHTT